jgi:hypothetical protein
MLLSNATAADEYVSLQGEASFAQGTTAASGTTAARVRKGTTRIVIRLRLRFTAAHAPPSPVAGSRTRGGTPRPAGSRYVPAAPSRQAATG